MSYDPQRLDTPGSLGELFQRVRNLERRLIGDIDFALLSGRGTVPAGPTTDQYIFDLQAEDGSNDPEAWTNDLNSDVFELGLHDFSSAGIVNPGDHQGVSILQTGTYLMFQRIQDGTAPGVTTSAKGLSVEYTKDGVNGVDRDFIYGDPFHTINGWGQNMRVFSLPNDVVHGVVPPSGPIALQSQNRTAETFTADVGLLIIRLPYALPFWIRTP